MTTTHRTLIQFFHWYTPGGGQLWGEVQARAPELARLGVTDVWLPPAGKGASGAVSVGYDTYDLFDLGEFDQKGSVATKYGDRAGLERATAALREAGLRVLHDAVMNHKMGADDMERVRVQRVDAEDRRRIDPEIVEASAYTVFRFPGRGGRHSRFEWTAACFTGVDAIRDPDEAGIFRIVNEHGDEHWNREVDDEGGNFDYLMGADIEFRNPAVYEEMKYWGRWLGEQVACDGFRLDAAKHIPAWFIRDWVGHMRETHGQDIFVVAEYWNPDFDALATYIERTDRQLAVFDVALHHRFHDAARAGADFDLRTIFDGSLVASLPEHAVTIVDNHDTQPLQALESPVEPWFKPLAYALILLREQGVPCVFHPDLYGAEYEDTGADGQVHRVQMPAIAALPRLIEARQRFAHGPQSDHFDEPGCIGFVRHGTAEQPGCVVVLANGGEAGRDLTLGPEHAGQVWVDFLGHRQDEVVLDDQGRGVFRVNGGSVSVWVVRT